MLAAQVYIFLSHASWNNTERELPVQSQAEASSEQSQHPARRKTNQVEVGDGSEEGWSYPYIALRDPVKNLVRIYGQYSVKVIGYASLGIS